jgi:ribosome-associated protein
MSDHDQQPPEADEPWISKRASGPSRSQRRREALDVLALAHALMDAPSGMLASVPLEDDMRELVATSRAVKTQIARKRQTQFLAKHLRRLDDDAIAALAERFSEDRDRVHREAGRLHRLEAQRDDLLARGDEALADLLLRYPDADRTRLRQLQRQALAERARSVPPRASRELFRLLRQLQDQADAAAGIAGAGLSGRGDDDGGDDEDLPGGSGPVGDDDDDHRHG